MQISSNSLAVDEGPSAEHVEAAPAPDHTRAIDGLHETVRGLGERIEGIPDHSAAIAGLHDAVHELGERVYGIPDHTRAIDGLHESLAALHGKLDGLRAPAIHPAIAAFAERLTAPRPTRPAGDVARISNAKLIRSIRKGK